MSPAPQDKAIGDSVSIDPNSKTRIAGQLREDTGCCPDHIFFFLTVSGPPWPHMHRKGDLQPKDGAMLRDVLPRDLFGRIHLG